MVGRAGKPTAGGRMGMTERNKTLATCDSLRALTVRILGKAMGITCICLRSNIITVFCHVSDIGQR